MRRRDLLRAAGASLAALAAPRIDRLDQTFPFSRVLEIDPATKEIVWKYQETPVSNFFSPRISNAQRLPNGNTLINEGWFGRFFEVTPEGAVVWEPVNPYFGGSPRPQEQTNQVFRAYRTQLRKSPGQPRRRLPRSRRDVSHRHGRQRDGEHANPMRSQTSSTRTSAGRPTINVCATPLTSLTLA
jgi:hypothetical protein